MQISSSWFAKRRDSPLIEHEEKRHPETCLYYALSLSVCHCHFFIVILSFAIFISETAASFIFNSRLSNLDQIHSQDPLIFFFLVMFLALIFSSFLFITSSLHILISSSVFLTLLRLFFPFVFYLIFLFLIWFLFLFLFFFVFFFFFFFLLLLLLLLLLLFSLLLLL